MLSDVALRSALDAGELTITYAFLPDASGEFHQRPAPAKVGSIQAASEFFEQNLVRSRIALTLGPLVRLLPKAQRLPRASRYAGHPEIVDLRTVDDAWQLQPGHSVVVFTNEHVTLSKDLVGIIIGRVSNYHTGLVTTTCYVDSTWEGLIELHLTNTSRRPVALRIGMEIGRIFLFETDDGSVAGSNVSTQGLHYGFTWPRILNDRVDPFPRQWALKRKRSIGLAIDTTNEFLKKYAGYGIVTLTATVAVASGSLYSDARELFDISSDVQGHGEAISSLTARMPVLGVEELELPSGQLIGSTTVALPPDAPLPSGTSFVDVIVRSDVASTATAAVRSSGGRVVLDISVRVERPRDVPVSVEVSWMYVP